MRTASSERSVTERVTLISVKANHRKAGRGVGQILNAFLVECAVDAVFGAEEELELESGNGFLRVISRKRRMVLTP